MVVRRPGSARPSIRGWGNWCAGWNPCRGAACCFITQISTSVRSPGPCTSTRRRSYELSGPSAGPVDQPVLRLATSCVRELTPSLRKTLRRWNSTVLVLMNSSAAMSRLRIPPRTSRATAISWGVSRTGRLPLSCGRRDWPHASSSRVVTWVKGAAPSRVNVSRAVISASVAARRRPSRRRVSPCWRWTRASSKGVPAALACTAARSNAASAWSRDPERSRRGL